MFECADKDTGSLGDYELYKGKVWRVTNVKNGRTKRVRGEPIEDASPEQKRAAENSVRGRLGAPRL
jgi:hypothetical protein